jgi:hypothetical protein
MDIFCRTIRATSVYFVVYAFIFLFVIRLGQWARQHLSIMGMSGHFGADPLWACVKVADVTPRVMTGLITIIKDLIMLHMSLNQVFI